MKTITGNVVDVVARTITKAKIVFDSGKIISVEPAEDVDDQFIIPGFVDAHIHIESSMMPPAEFARYSLPHGTVACVCDPHEIANVCGVSGIEFMIENGRHSPMKFFFGAPSCVPSTRFETSGAVLDARIVRELLERDDIYFLAEMMNYPGVIHKNEQVCSKLLSARELGKPIDGHAPDLHGLALEAYVAAGISTDHECMTLEDAEAKIELGMLVQIREGSAAKNFDDLLPLLDKYPDKIMFCSDDKHPDDLLQNGHINALARRAVARGYDPVDVLRACSLVPVRHYHLNVGLLQVGDEADFVVVDNITDFSVRATYLRGDLVAADGAVVFPRYVSGKSINHFLAPKINLEQLHIRPTGSKMKVIQAGNGQLYTSLALCSPKIDNGNVVSDVESDILKLVVYNRYKPSDPAIGFIRNVGLKRGALASTVAHDSHNIVAVGASDQEIVAAINHLVSCQGGIVACDGDRTCLLPLPVAGLMSDDEGSEVAHRYEQVEAMARELGSTLTAPFMTVAFMSLLVIPELKLGDRGLFDGRNFQFVDLMD